jgi:hypothetical protein
MMTRSEAVQLRCPLGDVSERSRNRAAKPMQPRSTWTAGVVLLRAPFNACVHCLEAAAAELRSTCRHPMRREWRERWKGAAAERVWLQFGSLLPAPTRTVVTTQTRLCQAVSTNEPAHPCTLFGCECITCPAMQRWQLKEQRDKSTSAPSARTRNTVLSAAVSQEAPTVGWDGCCWTLPLSADCSVAAGPVSGPAARLLHDQKACDKRSQDAVQHTAPVTPRPVGTSTPQQVHSRTQQHDTRDAWSSKHTRGQPPAGGGATTAQRVSHSSQADHMHSG